MNDKDYSMDALLEEVREAVRDAVSEAGEDYDAEELAWEIADSFEPIYDYDALQYAIKNIYLATNTPGSSPKEDNAIGFILANIYDECHAVVLEDLEIIRNETGTTNES